MNLQDGFLNQIRRENAEIRLVLLDGSDMTGRVRGFDNFTVVLEDETTQRLVYKHAIAQIVHLRGGEGSGQPDQAFNAMIEAATTHGSGAEGGPGGRREPRRDRRPDRDRDRRGGGGRPPEPRRQERPRAEPRAQETGQERRGADPSEARKSASFNPLDLSKLNLAGESATS